jgi:hypothetical protein
MNLFDRAPENCANGLNIFIAIFLGRLVLTPAHSIYPIHFLLVGVALLLAALLVYIAYQAGWHPLLLPFLALLLLSPALVPWIAYVSVPALLFILVHARLYLQRHGYIVGLVGARFEPGDGGPPTPLPRKKIALRVAGIFGVPWILFGLVWIINPVYNEKFFEHSDGVEWWLGPVLFLFAVGLTVVSYPLGLEYCRLQRRRGRWSTEFQAVLTLLIAIALWLALAAILIMTPAALTMMQQMKHV